jgi:hypothetical protein
MTFLRRVSETFWSYVSPRKTQQRREKEFKFKVPPVPTRRYARQQEGEAAAGPMTLETRLQRWEVKTPSRSGITSGDAANLPPSPPISLSSPTSLERPYTDFEGDSLIDSLAENFNRNPKEDIDANGESVVVDANEETFVVDDGQYATEHKKYDPELELERRELQGQELRAAGWTEDAIFLFQKLGLRGFEPLLPYEWFEDFTSLPADLFTKNPDKAFIKPMSPEVEYHAYKALEELLGLGGRVRDAVLQKSKVRTAERHTRHAVLKYNKWALRDGKVDNMWNNISLFDIASVAKHVPATIAEAKMLRKLGKRAEQWREAFEERRRQDEQLKDELSGSIDGEYEAGPDLPTLYGVVACHTIMAFVSYDVHAATPLLRTVAMFDLGQEGYDVWNSLAIAIFVIHCRNRLIQLRDSVPVVEPEKTTTESDPDA